MVYGYHAGTEPGGSRTQQPDTGTGRHDAIAARRHTRRIGAGAAAFLRPRCAARAADRAAAVADHRARARAADRLRRLRPGRELARPDAGAPADHASLRGARADGGAIDIARG